MFYSENILVKKGPLANVWLAANWDRKLSKTQILHTDIAGTVQDLVSGELPPMALRLSGQLLLGVSKIYGRQARYLLEDCGEALSRFQESKSAATATEASAAPVQRLKSTTIKAQELLAKQEEEPEFNVEEFLRAVPAAKMSLTPSKRMAAEDFLLPPSEANLLSPGANADLLQALNIEAGRLMSDQFSPLPDGVEVGRRASEVSAVRESLPLSPLRSPLASVGEEGINNNNDDFGYPLGGDDYAAPIMDQELDAGAPVSDQLQQLPISPPQSAAKRPKRRSRPNTASVVLDEETELEHLHNTLPTIAAQKKNAKATLLSLLNKPLASEDAFADLFNDIVLSSPARRQEQQEQSEEQMHTDLVEQPHEEEIQLQEDFGGEEMVPMMEDDAEYAPPAVQEAPHIEAAVSSEDLVIDSFPFSLQAYLTGMNRRKACQVFFQVLAGCNNREYRAAQSEPYAPISLTQF